MYVYFCKDSNCKGHTKSWERCCDLRAFAACRTAAAASDRHPAPRAASATPRHGAPGRLPV